jgi:RHS repeat-associated protein
LQQKDAIYANFESLGLDPVIFKAGKSGKIPYGRLKKYYRDANGNGVTHVKDTTKATANANEMHRYFYHSDHLGSSSYISDASGEVYQHFEYFPFGETFYESRHDHQRTPYLYNGKELDKETGLYYYGARYYDPKISMFYGVDRFAEKYYDLSPYQYGANNPLKFIDINGDSLNIAPEHRGQLGKDLTNTFGDKTSNFSYSESGNLIYNGNANEDFEGKQLDAFNGINKVMSSKQNIELQYADKHTNADGVTIDVVDDTGGGLYEPAQNMIVVSPNATDVDVIKDNFMDILNRNSTNVKQNTTSVLFHEIGEVNEGTTSGLRGGVIDYENIVREIIGLPNRPYDEHHSHTIKTTRGDVNDYINKK